MNVGVLGVGETHSTNSKRRLLLWASLDAPGLALRSKRHFFERVRRRESWRLLAKEVSRPIIRSSG